MVILTLTARWLRTLHQFTGADPWNGNCQTEFTIEEYVMTPTGVRKAVENSGYAHRLSIRSKLGGEHMLPESLVELWRTGQVAAERIPALRMAIGPRLLKEDFNLILHRQAVKTGLLISVMVVFLITLVVIAFATRSEGHFSLPLALFISLTMALVTGGIVWSIRRAATRRRVHQMQWLLDAESGVPSTPLPGRAKTQLKRFAVIYGLIIAVTVVILGGVFAWVHLNS